MTQLRRDLDDRSSGTELLPGLEAERSKPHAGAIRGRTRKDSFPLRLRCFLFLLSWPRAVARTKKKRGKNDTSALTSLPRNTRTAVSCVILLDDSGYEAASILA